ncbi:MAG TPA: type II toxin-antitoxin system death-on-curing family toxin [Vicinamibacteria bacterium]|nr:type II toxin-antitoxin system death-on-curing family toxin [Vicinamibacteria bacterium]
MTSEGRPIWIREDVVEAIHSRQLAEHGGSAGVRDAGLLSSALARPRNLLAYSNQVPDLAVLAAAYASGIMRNHPFVDGNKRTAYVVGRLFLRLNGHDISATREDKYRTFLRLAGGEFSEQELVDWIRERLVERSHD